MNEVLTFVGVLLLIYFLECIAWVPEASFVFRSRWMRNWKPANSLLPAERFGHRVYLANPIPAYGDLAVCEPLRPNVDRAGPEGFEQRLRRMLDTKSARRRLWHFRRVVRPLYLDSYLLFSLVFVAFPIVAWRLGMWVSLLLLAPFLLITANTVYSFRRIHRVFEPHAKADRREKTLALVLSPLGAIRAPALLLRSVMAGFHPLAVAAAEMPKEDARRFAARVLRDMKFSQEKGAEDTNTTQTRWHEAVWEWARKEFGDPEALTGPPLKKFDRSVTYCPRCEQEYVVTEGECADCGGVALERFETLAKKSVPADDET